MESRLQELWTLVRSIPAGRVTSYGALGRELSSPTTGRIVGRWMAQCPDDVPWWRVVGAAGDLRTAARDPHLAKLQRDLLESEGVTVSGGRAALSAFWTEFLTPQ